MTWAGRGEGTGLSLNFTPSSGAQPVVTASTPAALDDTAQCVLTVVEHLRINYADTAQNTNINTAADIDAWAAQGGAETVEWRIYGEHNYVTSIGLLAGTKTPEQQLRREAPKVAAECVSAHQGTVEAGIAGLAAAGLGADGVSVVGGAARSTAAPAPPSPSPSSTPDSAPRTESAPAPRPVASEPPLDAVECDVAGLLVGPKTSCAFADKVMEAWYANGGSAIDFDAYSPVTKRTYRMHCVQGPVAGANTQLTTCRSETGATVYLY